jgi:hypothetical protein
MPDIVRVAASFLIAVSAREFIVVERRLRVLPYADADGIHVA